MLLVVWQEGYPAWKKLCGGVLGRDAYLHTSKLMPLPLTVCFSKIQIGSGTGSPG